MKLKHIKILMILCISPQCYGQLFPSLHQLENALKKLTTHIQKAWVAAPNTPPAQILPNNNAPLTWQQLLVENKRREQYAQQHHLPECGVAISVTADAKYQTLHALKAALESPSNKKCITFDTPQQTHMTMLYMHVPFETTENHDEHARVQDISTTVVNTLQESMAYLKTLQFTYNSIGILGVQHNVVVALYDIQTSISDYQQKFILAFANAIFPIYPHAWLGFIDAPKFHISLGKIKPQCQAASLMLNSNLPPVGTFQLKKGDLKVSVKGPTTKPYFRKVAGW